MVLERNGKYTFCVSWTKTDKLRYHGPIFTTIDIILTDGSEANKNCSEGEIKVGLKCVVNDI